MRSIVEADVVAGLSFELAVDNLAEYLGIDRESVLLGIALANEWAPLSATWSEPAPSVESRNLSAAWSRS
jgi:hypothetical protein